MEASQPQHWLCVAITDNGQLIHGCLVYHAEPWAEISDDQRYSENELGGAKLHIIQSLLGENAAVTLASELARRSVLDLSGLGGPSIPVNGQRRRLLDGYGISGRPTITYPTAVFPDLPDGAWSEAIGYLSALFGGDFRKHPDQLGAFVVFGDIRAPNISAPVIFEVDRAEGADLTVHPDRFSLVPLGSLKAPVCVLVELMIYGERAYSKLFAFEGPQSQTVKAVAFDEYRLSIFDESGELIFTEGYPLFLSMGFNLSSVAQTYSLQDELTASSRGLGKNLSARASSVTTRSTSRSLVGVNNVAFDIHQSRARSLSQRLAPASTGDRWFPKGVANEVDVIQHLNSLLDGGRVASGVIVDPFFGVDTLKRVVARLESLDVKLTVVMSLAAVNPETNEQKDDLVGELQRMLEGLRRSRQRSAITTLRVVNLADGDGQAFHDRYLLLSLHEGEREVYLLSNSLNNMAGKWPFCISKLDPAAARDAARYIDGLVQGRDISGSTRPTVTFQWPLP